MPMLPGLLCALGAGIMWGLVFVCPLILPDYPGIVLSFGRYIAFGAIALLPAWFDRRRLSALTRQDWGMALRLALIGNLLYYAALASAIQLAGAPLPVMLIGTLPVVISVYANWSTPHAGEAVAWRRLLPSLLLIGAGLALVNADELERLDAAHSSFDYVLGCLLALGAVAAWTWYPVTNARYLKAQPHIASSTWATAQGLATLAPATVGYLCYGAWAHAAGSGFAFPLGPRALPFVGMMLLIGLCASWLGTLLWNQASQRLPAALAGQLIVFETLAALLYAFLWRASLPGWMTGAGIVLLCAGVLAGVRVFRAPADHPSP